MSHAARVPHRRHHPREHQQPGRLHDPARRGPHVGLLDGCRQDHPGADLPRQRRRPRGRRARRAARVRVPPGVQARRGHRPHLLPPARPQRGRRPLDDAAADVQPDRGEALGAHASTPRRSSAAATSPKRSTRRRTATSRSASSARSPRPTPRRPARSRSSRRRRTPPTTSSARSRSRTTRVGEPDVHGRSTEQVVDADRRRARQPARRVHRAPEAAAAAEEARSR